MIPADFLPLPYRIKQPAPVAGASTLAGSRPPTVDAFGRPARHGTFGIPCKRLAELGKNNNPYSGGPISRALLRKEAKAALSFLPDLKLWILATTVRQDTRAQVWVDELNKEWERSGRDRIAIVWTWDERIYHLNSYPKLQRNY